MPLSQLAPEQALRRLELHIVRRLEGFLHGEHLGLMPGSGSDMAEARVYNPGEDDVRRMDWAVTARTTVPHVRDVIADRELETWALVDLSPSMHFGTAAMEKRDLAVAAVATLGLLTFQVGDRFGGYILSDGQVQRWPARPGRLALFALLRALMSDESGSRAGRRRTARPAPGHRAGPQNLAQSITQLAREPSASADSGVVVSDFIEPSDAARRRRHADLVGAADARARDPEPDHRRRDSRPARARHPQRGRRCSSRTPRPASCAS